MLILHAILVTFALRTSTFNYYYRPFAIAICYFHAARTLNTYECVRSNSLTYNGSFLYVVCFVILTGCESCTLTVSVCFE